VSQDAVWLLGLSPDRGMEQHLLLNLLQDPVLDVEKARPLFWLEFLLPDLRVELAMFLRLLCGR